MQYSCNIASHPMITLYLYLYDGMYNAPHASTCFHTLILICTDV